MHVGQAPRWLAILACLFASAVPAAGLVLCVHHGNLEFGVGDECPCDLPDDHPDCDHVDVIGGGEVLTATARPGRGAAAGVADATPETPPLSAVIAADVRERAPPPGGRSGGRRGSLHGNDRPWITRHLRAHRTTSLLA